MLMILRARVFKKLKASQRRLSLCKKMVLATG